jgi:serine/threonine protein kinase
MNVPRGFRSSIIESGPSRGACEMTEAVASGELAPPSIGGEIAHYQLVSRLGEGGMGVVYRALDRKLRREVALKVLHPRVAQDPDRRRRFLREGRLAAHLTHPCIATVYEVGESDGKVFIAMELVEGVGLNNLTGRGRQYSLAEALQIMHEVVRGLAKAHEAGVIHRDLKPDNIIVGEEGIVKILDFGVAKSLVGTPAYMSPEQAAGKEVDARSDIFSVGVVLYEMLTAKRPFEGDTWQETIIAINRDELVPVSAILGDVPPEIDLIIARCLAKRAADRYPSCKELLEDLSQLVMTSITGTFPPGMSGILHGAVRSSNSSDSLSNNLARDRTSTVVAPASHAKTIALVAATALVTVVVGIYLMNREMPAQSSVASDAEVPAAAPPSAPPAHTSAPTSPIESAATVEPAASVAPSSALPSSVGPSTSASTSASPRKNVDPAPPKPAPSTVPAPRPTPSPGQPKNPLLGF